jgi:hypothetical protein
MTQTLRFLSKSFLFATIGAMALAGQALAQTDISFKATPIYSGSQIPNNPSNQIVVYNLPATGPHAGAATSSFNVQATIGGTGTRPVAGYGLIMALPGGATSPSFVVGTLPATGEPNNLNPVNDDHVSVTQNTALSDSILGDLDVPGVTPGGNYTVGVVGLYLTSNTDTTLQHNDGLFSIPISVPAGATGSFELRMALGAGEYSGFANNAGTILTPSDAFPQANQTILVRQSRIGDINGDTAIDSFDIQPFVSLLGSIPNFKAARPWLQAEYIGDIDSNGAVDSFDIQPFVALLGAGSPPAAVPEPSTVALGAMGLVALLAARFRRRKS